MSAPLWVHHSECTIVSAQRSWDILIQLCVAVIFDVPGDRQQRRGSRRDRPRPNISSQCRCQGWTVLTLLPPHQLTCFLQQPLRLPHLHPQPPPPPPPQCWNPLVVSTHRASVLCRVWSPGQNLKLNDQEGQQSAPPSFSRFGNIFQVFHQKVRINSHPTQLGQHQHPHSVTPSLVRKATVTAVESGQSVYFFF